MKQQVFRPTLEQSEKIESVRNIYGFNTASDAIKKIIDEFSPICEICYGGNAKRIRKNGSTIFLCEVCNEKHTHP